MPTTYLRTLSAFTHFLTAYIHTLLHQRALYPLASFHRTRFHNTPVFQNRHPDVCNWVLDAVAAVREELLKGTVARIGIVVYHAVGGDRHGGEGDGEGKGMGSAKIIERYMIDVSGFPVVTREERFMDIEWAAEKEREEAERQQREAAEEQEQQHAMEVDSGPSHKAKGKQKKKEKPLPHDAEVDVDLSEQFRAAFITLITRTSTLDPLPPDCSFNVTMELKDEADVDPPIGHSHGNPQRWMPVQPSLQKTGRKGAEKETHGRPEGEDLGGARVTPVRTVEAGVFRFEAWIEEGRDKFEIKQKGAPKNGFDNPTTS